MVKSDMSLPFPTGGGESSNADEQSTNNLSSTGNERDELEEVRKFTSADTRKIRVWRTLVALVLLATALAVTLTTYSILSEEQDESFEAAFTKFSRTVGDAAVLQQQILRESQMDVGRAMSVDAVRTGQTWPNYTNSYFEVYAGSALQQARAELSAFFTHVEADQRGAWSEYATAHLKEWAHPGHMYKYGSLDRLNETGYIADMRKKTSEGFVPDDEWDEYWPMWHYSPPPAQYGAVNWNLINVPDYFDIVAAQKVIRGEPIICKVRKSVSTGTAFTEEEHNRMHSALKTGSSPDHPHTFIWTPIYEDPYDVNSKYVATIATGFAWDFSLRNLLPDNVRGLVVVIYNNCNQTYTYTIDGPDAYFFGAEDLHEEKYSHMKVTRDLNLVENPLANSTFGHCMYSIDIYPSSEFEATYNTNTPEVFAIVVAVTFTCVALVFIIYDVLVNRRNNRLLANAARSNAVVTSLFPGTMRDRILEAQEHKGTKGKMKSLIASDASAGNGAANQGDSKPLADLFLETTIMFADITGFTAWSSVRAPEQVFTLLESVYGNFDVLAKQRRIFKVETVGDCYVAATGIPEPRKDHVIAMVRFAKDCINSMKGSTRMLEKTLGPGTSNLGIRVGLHSGPVTAGVLRGERARFQLFGDTMNTTARIESSSATGRIHVSQATAQLLKESGKEHWLVPRHDRIQAKGKGQLTTYWVEVNEKANSAGMSSNEGTSVGDSLPEDEEEQRLIEWNVEMLSRLVKQVVARRQAAGVDASSAKAPMRNPEGPKTIPLDEVKEIISLPEFDPSIAAKQVPADDIVLEPQVVQQLHDYVTAVAYLYHHNPFHNLAHASHVVMSVIKLMSRIVAPEAFHDNNDCKPEDNVAQSMHDHTYGITSDPLTQFACAFSALIHDVDHRGVPNTQLVKENTTMGDHYRGRSVAEQNSFDLAWDMLMDTKYSDLVSTLCQTQQDLSRLRELVVNGVLATDITDKELKNLRNQRWNSAFSEEHAEEVGSRAAVNRKATIVIEHLIQASDVAHTMQHWHVFRKWNENLFLEMYQAYKDGRSDKDPSEFWYQGEIGFFDFYIIPLAKKLKDCGVFGVSSGEYLSYAQNNRQEWEAKGMSVVAEMVEKVKSKELSEARFTV